MKYVKNEEDPNIYVMYKDKFYLLDFIGDTKYGYRAKLYFLDKSKSFWVDAQYLNKMFHPLNEMFVKKQTLYKKPSSLFDKIYNNIFSSKRKNINNNFSDDYKNSDNYYQNKYGEPNIDSYDDLMYDLDPDIGDH